MDDVKIKDCTTCKHGWVDERLNIPFCHNYKCENWELWESKNETEEEK